jgi:hyaluronoglucosaminidase
VDGGVSGTPPLGIIEGYYGRPWAAEDRLALIADLAPLGFSFFIHAPKADPYLRRRWREDHPAAETRALAELSADCAKLGVRFGVGLSPYEIYLGFDEAAKTALARKLAWLDEIGVTDLAILFDDMRGDLPDLAARQADILHWIAERTSATRLIICPTYYSDDPVLDRVFGSRPPGYLDALGAALDPAIDVFWTGAEVCSREYSAANLHAVARVLRRPPVLWDNYPVNDGPIMSRYLHQRAVTGRSNLAGHVRGHAVNPANQPTLSRIPARTLAEAYDLGEAYDYGQAWGRAARAVLGDDLAAMVERHLYLFQETGLDRLGDTAGRLRERYAAFDHPAAREILAWLDGAYAVTREAIEAS